MRENEGFLTRSPLVQSILQTTLGCLAAMGVLVTFSPNISLAGLPNAIVSACVFSLVWRYGSLVSELDGRTRIATNALAAIYSLGWSVGRVISGEGSFRDLRFGLPLLLIVIVGSFVLFRTLVTVLPSLVTRRPRIESVGSLTSPGTLCAVVTVISACYLIAFYPGVTFNDGMRQLHSWFGDIPWTGHDPIFSTFLIGVTASLGRLVADDNFGMFLYNVVILAYSAYVFLRMFRLIERLQATRMTRLGTLAYFVGLPIVHLYLITMCKDTAFALTTLLLVVLLVEMRLASTDGAVPSATAFVGVFACLLLMCNFRNDGVYVALLTLVVALPSAGVRRPLVVGGLVSLVAFRLLMGSVLLPAFGIERGSVREALSVPLQQIALSARERPDDFSAQDRTIIGELFSSGPEGLAEAYDPNLSDPVKGMLIDHPTTDQLLRLFSVWAHGLEQHPGVYLRACLFNYYGYLYPDMVGNEAGFTDYAVSDYYQFNMDHSFVDDLAWAREGIHYVAAFASRLPVVSWLYCPGFYVWSLLACVAISWSKGRPGDLVPLAPLLGVVIIACLSPVNCRIRYVLPLVFCLPVILLYARSLLLRSADTTSRSHA